MIEEPKEITLVTYVKGAYDERDYGNVTFFVDPLEAKDLANALTCEIEEIDEAVRMWHDTNPEPRGCEGWDTWNTARIGEHLKLIRNSSADMQQVLHLNDFTYHGAGHIEFYLETLGKGMIG